MENNSLQHHGIKGMRWGVRRFQKKNGTLTSAGKNRYSDDYKEVSNLRKKKLSEMSNAEIRKLNDRTQLEQNYKRLHPSTVKKGMAIVGATAAAMGTAMSLYNNGSAVIKTGKSVGTKIIDAAGNMVMKDLAKGLM